MCPDGGVQTSMPVPGIRVALETGLLSAELVHACRSRLAQGSALASGEAPSPGLRLQSPLLSAICQQDRGPALSFRRPCRVQV